MSFVKFENVYKRYKMGEITINAADGVSFEIEKGEFAVIVGASGAGKLLYLICSAAWIPATRARSLLTARTLPLLIKSSSQLTADMT